MVIPFVFTIFCASASALAGYVIPIKYFEKTGNRLSMDNMLFVWTPTIVFTTMVCIYASLFEELPEVGSIYFEMRPLHEMVLFIVICVDSIELSLFHFHGVGHLEDATYMYAHHILGILGISYQLYFEIGGGLMVRFLTDAITFSISLVCDWVTVLVFPMVMTVPEAEKRDRMREWFSVADDVAFWIFRMWLYTFYSVQVLYHIVYYFWWSPLAPVPLSHLVWAAMVTVWTVFAFHHHCTIAINSPEFQYFINKFGLSTKNSDTLQPEAKQSRSNEKIKRE